jgi:prepilin-type N-terminal cleavage/methylation domain-containing protein
MIRVKAGQRGITLLELMVAMILMVMVSSMLYSVLNAGIGFTRKGEDKLLQVERNRSLLDLLHRQVHGAWYDKLQGKVRVTAEGDFLQVVTTAPLLNRDAGVVLALYFYDPAEDTLFYAEKRDFYNPLYEEDYFPDREEMEVLLKEVGGISWEFDNDRGMLQVLYGDHEYSLAARCWRAEDL